jgi:CRISPR system Cascade subunit CasA
LNLLTDPIFRAETTSGPNVLSLPELLAQLGTDHLERLVGLQRHQHDAFHVFLCYLAGAVLARRGISNPVQSAEFWREGLLELSGDLWGWELSVDDLEKPGFMQVPLPAGSRPNSEAASPDALDVLQTAKNHDVKQARALQASIDSWVYSLISLQTMSGFLGRGNQGISRMNSGFGNRPIVELMRSRALGQRWRDAVERLLLHRDQVLSEPFGYDPRGLVLLWLEPWDGQSPLALSQLDPFYIEVCRRVRLVWKNGRIIKAHLYSADKPRIAAKELNGVVGDPWLPVDLKGVQKGDAKALTFPPVGITADHMRRLIFHDEVKLSALQRPLTHWRGSLLFSVSVLVRGQGVTDGFHHWEVRIPQEKVPSLFGGASRRKSLDDLSKTAIEYAGIMQNRVLKPAVFAHILGAPDRLRLDDDFSTAAWTGVVRDFELRWSADYFPWLWSVPEPFDEDQELDRWTSFLHRHALAVLERAEAALPGYSGRRYLVKTTVRNVFWGAFYKNFDTRGSYSEHSSRS